MLATVPRIDELDLVRTEIDGLHFWALRGDFAQYYATAVPYEAHVLAPLLKDAAHARRVVDVGCNIGLIALPVARAMPRGGKVYCLDISQRNCRLLIANARHNGLDNIIVYPVGGGARFDGFPVALRPGTLQLLCSQRADTLRDTEIAFTVPLDALFADGERIEILKIDTDGYEYPVLQGAQRLLASHRPIVYLEYSDAASIVQTGIRGSLIIDLLERNGYQPTILHRDEPPQDIPAGTDLLVALNEMWLHDWKAGITHLDIRWHVPQ